MTGITIFKKDVGKISRQQEEKFSCLIISSRCDRFSFLKSDILSALFLSGNDNVGGLVAALQIDLLISRIFSVKKLANSVQALVECSSGAAVTGGFG